MERVKRKSELRKKLESEGWKFLTNIHSKSKSFIGKEYLNRYKEYQRIKIADAYNVWGELLPDSRAVYGKRELIFRNDEDGAISREFYKMYGRMPESDPKATGYLPNGEPTYLQVLDQTAEEMDKDLFPRFGGKKKNNLPS